MLGHSSGVAFLAVFIYATHVTQAIAFGFGWKLGFNIISKFAKFQYFTSNTIIDVVYVSQKVVEHIRTSEVIYHLLCGDSIATFI